MAREHQMNQCDPVVGRSGMFGSRVGGGWNGLDPIIEVFGWRGLDSVKEIFSSDAR